MPVLTRSRPSSPVTELASVAQFPARMGELGAQAALDAVNGVAVEPNIDTGTEMVTAENAAEFGG